MLLWVMPLLIIAFQHRISDDIPMIDATINRSTNATHLLTASILRVSLSCALWLLLSVRFLFSHMHNHSSWSSPIRLRSQSWLAIIVIVIATIATVVVVFIVGAVGLAILAAIPTITLEVFLGCRRYLPDIMHKGTYRTWAASWTHLTIFHEIGTQRNDDLCLFSLGMGANPQRILLSRSIPRNIKDHCNHDNMQVQM